MIRLGLILLVFNFLSCTEEKKVGITYKTIDRQKKVLEEIYEEDRYGVLTIEENFINFEICNKENVRCKSYAKGEFVIADENEDRIKFRIDDPPYSEGPLDVYVYNLNKEEGSLEKVLIDHGADVTGDYYNLTELSGEIKVVIR